MMQSIACAISPRRKWSTPKRCSGGRVSSAVSILELFRSLIAKGISLFFPSFRDGAQAPDPESRDSGFDAPHRPGMTTETLLNRISERVDHRLENRNHRREFF